MPDIKRIKQLHQKKHRQELGQFVVEGKKSVEELLRSDLVVTELYHTGDWGSAAWLKQSEAVDAKTMQRMSSLKQAPGLLAVAKIPASDGWPPKDGKPIILLDDISDPGNLGTIIRLADWFDAHLALTRDCVECFNPKVVQASMGSVFRLKEYRKTREEWLSHFTASGYEIAIADMNGEAVETAKSLPKVIVIGNEAHGVSALFKTNADRVLAITNFGKAESLNAATATAILLYEARKGLA